MTVQTEGKAKWHKGHRQRVIERIGKESTQSMRDYELIEALLFFSTPQRGHQRHRQRFACSQWKFVMETFYYGKCHAGAREVCGGKDQ